MEDRLGELIERLRRFDLAHNPLDSLGITPAQVLLLLCVGSAPGCRLQHVVECLGLTPPTVSVGVRRSEKAGLVRRTSDARDQRAICLFLTKRGQDLYDAAGAYRGVVETVQDVTGIRALEGQRRLLDW